MKFSMFRRRLWITALAGGFLMSGGCLGLVRDSVREGVRTFAIGGVRSTLTPATLGDFLFNVFTGGFGGFFGDDRRT